MRQKKTANFRLGSTSSSQDSKLGLRNMSLKYDFLCEQASVNFRAFIRADSQDVMMLAYLY